MGPGLGPAASGGTGTFFFFAIVVLALVALTAPRFTGQLRSVRELGSPLAYVLLLERPG
jgi:hypothetical protein